MISKYVKEQKRYTQDELRKIFECNTDETVQIVRKLKEYGIVKNVKKSDRQSMLSDLVEKDVRVTDIESGERELYYVFSFVGVIVVYGRVLKCYPKYINSCDNPIVQMKQILKVLEKYNAKEQVIKLYNESDDGGSFNLLAVMLYLLQDYYDNGIYIKNVDIVETNGAGEILWDRTINETFSYISNNRPYYIELQTKKRISDEYDFIRRLHACILTKFSKELEESDLPELFNIVTVELSEESLDDLGDDDYILYRIQNELNVQYNTRKQLVLKAMYAYIAQKASFNNIDSFSIYGTNSFNLVWEKVCAQNFGNVLYSKLSELPLGVCDEYKDSKDSTLIEIIDRPIWHRTSGDISDGESDTLRPDLIRIYECGDSGEYCFGIYDAKYYNIDFHRNTSDYRIIGQPGVGDVTKQYLYQLAYDDFITKQGYKYVQNMFFCPDEVGDKEYGWVQMDMLRQIGGKKLENVAVVKLCASDMYSLYLANHMISKNEMDKYIPAIGRQEIDNQNFANRMMSYLTRITTTSKLAKKKLEMKASRGQLIYPKQIKRELGAKIIYDTICPAASNSLYGFNPYKKGDYESMVAEDIGDSYSRCSQIADVSIEIEKIIKSLSETELRNEKVLKAVLKKCIESKTDIKSMANGRSLDMLTDKIMELVVSVYL
mgnify:CR=1 FL=1